MSFSKARIQRFNELPSEAPPPGAYDPKFNSMVQGSGGKKAKSTTSSGHECNASTSSRSNSSLKQFRTPQLPKKRAVVKTTGASCPRAKTKLYTERDSQSMYESKQELSDLRVECANKDKTIQEYEKQIDDVKAELQCLGEKHKILQNEYAQIEKEHQKEIESMAKLQQDVLENSSEAYEKKIDDLQSQLSLILKNEDENNREKKRVEEELKGTVRNLEQQLSKWQEQDELINQMIKLDVATETLDEISKTISNEMSNKDLQITNFLALPAETEPKPIEIKNSEKQVAELEGNFESGNNDDNSSLVLSVNQQLLDEMTTVLQEYIDYDNSDGKWNVKNIAFQPEIENFLKTIKKLLIKLKSAYDREMELSRDNFNEERENLEQELESKRTMAMELENKLAESTETNSFLTEELQDVQDLYKEMNRTMSELKTELELANDKYNKVLSVHKAELELTVKRHLEERTKLKDLLEEARSEYLKELDNMTTARNEELSEVKLAMEKRIEDEKKRMKECANKMVENAEAVTRETLKACRAESEERVRRIIAETDALTWEAKNSSADELRKMTEKYNARLDHMENEMDNLRSKLEERDVEVMQLTAALEEMKCTAEMQESFSQSLQSELDRAEAELMEKKEVLRNLKDQIRMESAEMVARRRRFDVVMSENQASVAALTHRLAQSEAEVERLQNELQSKEASTTGHCDLFEAIAYDSKIVQKQLDSLTDNVEQKVELINQLEVKSLAEINTAKTAFNAKIDSLKSVTIDELNKAQKQCKLKSEHIVELEGNLKQMSDRLTEAMNMLLKLEEVNDSQLIEVSQLELENAKLQQQLDDKSQILEENSLSFSAQLQYHKTEISELLEQIPKLKKEIKVMEEKRDEAEERKYDFEELRLKYDDKITVLTQALESEKVEKEKFEKQMREYEQLCDNLKEEYKEMSEKYTEVINHSNPRQRIKYVSQLKEKVDIQQTDLLCLRQELESKNDLVNELRQANDKLKFDERRQLGLGKENVHLLSSPHKTLFSKSANTTPVASPHKPHTPLRDRND